MNVICPGFVRTPLVEKQIAEQARSHGISQERVITDDLEGLICEKMSQGRLRQQRAIEIILRAKHNLNEVPNIMRDVNMGWMIRYMHANGASMFFLIVYIHLFRGLYYGSYKYPRELSWVSGVMLLGLVFYMNHFGMTIQGAGAEDFKP